MAGVAIQIDNPNQQAIERGLRRLEERVGNLTPVLTDIGEMLINSFRARWNAGEDSEGNPWTPLKDSTLERKAKLGQPADVLVGYRQLQKLNKAITSAGGLSIGTGEDYGAIHQLGGEAGPRDRRVTIPARPFLGLSSEDEDQILEIIEEYILEAV